MRNIASKSRFTNGISIAAVAVAIAFSQPALAQTTAAIRGENAQPGATVTVTDTITGRTATTVVQEDGTFVIPGLRPSTYRVSGAGEAREVELPVGQTVTIDAAPEVAAATTTSGGEIIVRGRRDRREVRTATVGTSISQVQMENLPQNDRNFLNFAALAPGVVVSPDVGTNNKRIQAGGVSADNVNVYIDGTSHKNRVGFNGIAGQNFSQGNPFPQSAVQEFRVETQNYKAEYEQAGSAIITAITRTGGNTFQLGTFAEGMPKAWFGRPFFERDDGTPKPDFKRWQFGGDVGGPILPGVLHFFAAYEGTRQTNPSATVNAPPGLDRFDEGQVGTDFKQNLYFGKLSLFATDADTLHLSYFRRDEDDIRDFGFNRSVSNGRALITSTKNYQLEWNHRADTWFNEMTLGYFDSETGTPPVTVGPEIRLVTDQGDFFMGGRDFQQANGQRDKNFKNNFTYTGFDGHVIKAGVRLARNKLIRLENAFGLGQYTFNGADYVDFETSIPTQAVISLLPPIPMTSNNTYVGLFVQDDWTVNENWTVNYGLRWDYESNNFNQDFVTPERAANALRNYVGWQAAGIDAEDYISTGNNRKPYMKAFAPRLGVSYDVRGDRDLILFAGAGRYYDRNNFYTASLERLFLTARSDIRVNFCGAAGLPECTGASGQIQWNPAFRDAQALREALQFSDLSGDIWVLNNKTPPPYTDQFNIGFRKRLGDWQTTATLAHNRGHNQFIFVRGNREPDGTYTPDGFAYIRDPQWGPPSWLVPGYTGRLNFGSSEGKSRYTAVYLQAEKPWTDESRWGVTTTVTLSNARSNQARSFGEAEMFNAGEQTAYGWQPVYGLERWRFVASGILGLPYDFRISSTMTFSSGPRFGYVSFAQSLRPCVECIPFNESGILQPEKDIAYKNVDVRLAKSFRTPWGHELEANFQVFNLFDWVNRNYETWGAGNAGDGLEPPLEQENTVGAARSFQAGLRYRF